MALLLAPYNDAMRLGQGFNSYTHTLCIDNAVALDKDSVNVVRPNGPSQVVSYSSRFVEKLSEVMDAMNISFGSSIKKGTVEISGNTSAVDENKFKDSDLNAVVTVKVVNQTTKLQEHSTFKALDDMCGIEVGSPRFNEIYGDCYISGFIEGGEFTGIVSMKILDRSKSSSITSTIKSTMNSQAQATDFVLDPIRSSSFSSKSNASASTHETETTISVSWMGGGMIKEADKLWDLDEMYAAAAAFPSKVAECPQRTWAILTKYKANRSFVIFQQQQQQKSNKIASPLDYDNLGSYTSELFENFMEYKLLLKNLQDIMQDRKSYAKQEKDRAIDTDISTLISVRAALRAEMSKIVRAVDLLTAHPDILGRRGLLKKVPPNRTVEDIISFALEHKSVPDPPKNPSGPGSVKKPSDYGKGGETPTTPDDFDFDSMIAPEIWGDLMPVRKVVSTDPNFSPPSILPPQPPGPPPAPDPNPVVGPPLTEVSKGTAMALIAPSSEKGWGVVFQDDKGGLREATGWPNWKTNALQTTAKPRTGTPLSISGLGPDSNYELYFINDKNEVIQRNALPTEAKVSSDDMSIHPHSRLATCYDKQTGTRRIIFQQTDGTIRICSGNLDLKQPWALEPSKDWAAAPGSEIACYTVLQAIMIAFQAPDGKIVVQESSNMGSDWGKETLLRTPWTHKLIKLSTVDTVVVDNQGPANKIPTPLALTFWITPGANFTPTRDQIRLFFCDSSDQLRVWSFNAKRKLDERKQVEALLNEQNKPFTSKSSSFAAGVIINIGKRNIVEQHLLMQLDTSEIVVYVSKSEGSSFQLASK